PGGGGGGGCHGTGARPPLTPPLTTVRVDAYRLGGRAAEWLIRHRDVAAARTPLREVMPTTLVVRGSCGAGGERSRAGVTRSRSRRRRRGAESWRSPHLPP